MLPTVGVKCFSWTLDTVGLFAAGVEDLALGLSAITNWPELRPGRDRAAAHRHRDAGVRRRAGSRQCGGASGRQRRGGARRRFASALALPEEVAKAWDAHETVQEFEAHRALAWEYQTQYEAMPPLLRAKLDQTRGIPRRPITTRRAGSPTAAGRRWQKSSTMSMRCSTFSAPGAAPKGLASTGDTRFNKLWTLMGVPCVNVPAYIADGGLPVGVQVIARFGNDAGALKVARFLGSRAGAGVRGFRHSWTVPA